MALYTYLTSSQNSPHTMQGTRERKGITSRLRGVVNSLRRASTRSYSAQSTLSTNADIVDEALCQAAEFSPVSSFLYDLQPCVLCASEIYHSTGGCDTFSQHKYASVADLCSSLGRRIPIQLVKLVARDTLKALKDFHQNSDRPYRGLPYTEILNSLDKVCRYFKTDDPVVAYRSNFYSCPPASRFAAIVYVFSVFSSLSVPSSRASAQGG
jgi:hypothetical protein